MCYPTDNPLPVALVAGPDVSGAGRSGAVPLTGNLRMRAEHRRLASFGAYRLQRGGFAFWRDLKDKVEVSRMRRAGTDSYRLVVTHSRAERGYRLPAEGESGPFRMDNPNPLSIPGRDRPDEAQTCPKMHTIASRVADRLRLVTPS